MKKKINVTIDPRQHELIKAILAKDKVSFSRWLSWEAEEFIEDNLWQLLGDKDIKLTDEEFSLAHRSNNVHKFN